MTFTVKFGYILFESDRPGSHATMFAPDGNKMLSLASRTHLSDKDKRYAWAFSWDESVTEGQMFVFATSDRTMLAVASADNTLATAGIAVVKRYADGNPWEVVSRDPKAVAVEVAPPPPTALVGGLSAARPVVSDGRIPPLTQALVNVRGKGTVEVRGAGGELLYSVPAPIERMLLSPSAYEITTTGDVEKPLEFEPIA